MVLKWWGLAVFSETDQEGLVRIVKALISN